MTETGRAIFARMAARASAIICWSSTRWSARASWRRRSRKGEPDVHVIGFPGCYDNDYAIRLMLALATHPNIGGVLCVGLGCEYTQPHRIAEAVRQSGRPAESFFIQEHGGTRSSIALGKEMIASLRARAKRRRDQDADDLG